MAYVEQNQDCFYLDSDFQPASDMLRKCVNDIASPPLFNCSEDPMGKVSPSDANCKDE